MLPQLVDLNCCNQASSYQMMASDSQHLGGASKAHPNREAHELEPNVPKEALHGTPRCKKAP